MRVIFYLVMLFWLAVQPVLAMNLGKIFYSRLRDQSDQQDLVDSKEALRQSKNLIQAVHNGNFEKVTKALSKGADPNAINKIGTPALCQAASLGNLAIVNKLLEQEGIMVDAASTTKSQTTPIYVAAFHGHIDVLQALIKASGNVNLAAEHNTTPLYAAAFYGHEQAVSILIKAGADFNHERTRGETPLFAAAQNGHWEVVNTLLKQPNINKDSVWRSDNQTPIFIAAQNGHWHVVLLLLDSGADPTIADKDNTKVIDLVRRRIEEKGLQKLSRSLGRQLDPGQLMELKERLELYEKW